MNLGIRGFTLIELLVVVAIIGLLSSVVLGSLTSARTKAADAAIKQQLLQMRSAVALHHSTYGNYDTVCSGSTASGALFRQAFADTAKVDGANICMGSAANEHYYSTGGVLVQGGSGSKPATAGWWAAVVQLRSGRYFCMDWTGKTQEQASRTIDNGPLTMQCS